MKEKGEKEVCELEKRNTEQVVEEKISNVSKNDLSNMKEEGDVKSSRVCSEGFDDSLCEVTDGLGKMNIESRQREDDDEQDSLLERGPTHGVPVGKVSDKSMHIHPQTNSYMGDLHYEESYDKHNCRRRLDSDGPESVKYRRPTTSLNIQPQFAPMFETQFDPQNCGFMNNLSQSSAVPMMNSQGLYTSTPDFRFGQMPQAMTQTSQMVFTSQTSGGKVTVQSPVTPGQNPFPEVSNSDKLLDDWIPSDVANTQFPVGSYNNPMPMMSQQQQPVILPSTIPTQADFKAPQFNERRLSDPDSGLESADEKSPAPYDSTPSPGSAMSYPSPNSVDSGCGYSPMHETFGAENMGPKYQGQVGIASPASYRMTPSPAGTSGYGSPQRPEENSTTLNDDRLEELQIALEVVGKDLQTTEAKKKAIIAQKQQQIQIQQQQQQRRVDPALCMSPPSLPPQSQQMPPQQIMPSQGRAIPPTSLPVTMVNTNCMLPPNSMQMNMPAQSIPQPFQVVGQNQSELPIRTGLPPNQSGVQMQPGINPNQHGIPMQQATMPTVSQPNIPIPGLVATTTSGQAQQIIILHSTPMTTQSSQQSVVLVPVQNAAPVSSVSNKKTTQKKTPRPILPKTTSVPSSTSTSGTNTMSQSSTTGVTMTSRQPPLPPNKNVQQNQQVRMQQDKLLMIARRTVADIPREDLKKIDPDGDTYLHIAVCKTDRHMVQALLERLRREKMDELVDKENNRRQTPLYMAVFMKQPVMVAMFIKFQANVNALAQNLSADGQTVEVKAAIHVAASQGSDYLTTLIELLKAKDISINLSNNYGQTALHCAILAHNRMKRDSQERIDSIAIIRRLIEAGADPSSQDKKSGKTPLMYAIEQRNLNLVEAILTSVDPSLVRNVVRTQAYDGSSCLKIAEGLRESYDVRVWNQLWNRLQSAANGTVSRAQMSARTDPNIPLFPNEV